VYQATQSHPAIIGLIDGYFEVTPTVWHKEILWAMAQGIHVHGSASIGALRAAELCSFGMTELVASLPLTATASSPMTTRLQLCTAPKSWAIPP
jgi:hypothetical protein